ncbi:cupin domain-containing protein [Paraburkholderia acidisoli]|uniref:Cupin domain-containing protein n=1 Tax=Paraburkholderia acidisoli TaxID=2571748 RepID=A0A7Z2JJ56_9BURK|nr:cupin domain-containing protein [Paraburkholderia acidisoli]QGZ66456.1 cupin domain-containing protein [Paraburkholderia acidisoli]
MHTGRIESNETLEFAGMRTRVIAGVATQSLCTIMEMSIANGGGAPAHRSLDEDKTFVLLEGQLTFHLADAALEMRPGDAIAVARGDLHGFVAGEVEARLLLVSAPAGHDAFFRAMAALPVPHDAGAVRELCARHRQVIAGL